MNKPLRTGNHYINFCTEIKERIHRSQYNALKAVNKELIKLYWDIGRMIVDKQHDLGWGKSVVEQFSKDIQKAYPGIQGFSTRNLWNMKLFYSEIQQDEKLGLGPNIGHLGVGSGFRY